MRRETYLKEKLGLNFLSFMEFFPFLDWMKFLELVDLARDFSLSLQFPNKDSLLKVEGTKT